MSGERKISPDLYTALQKGASALEKELVSVAFGCLGKTEEGGDNRGVFVESLQKAAGAPIGTPWCLSFIQALIAYVEAKRGVRSPIKKTAGVMDLWNSSQQYALLEPKIGSIAIWKSSTSPTLGHCGIVVGSVPGGFVTIEGNTSDGVGLEREGEGIFLKVRYRGNLRTFIEMGFIQVFP